MTIPEDLHLFTEDWERTPAVPDPAPRRYRCAVAFFPDLSDLSDARREEELRRRLPVDRLVCVGRDVEGYAEALRSVVAEHGAIDLVLHLWGTGEGPVAAHRELLGLFQALIQERTSPTRVVLGGAFDGDEDEEGRCVVESWLGFERSIGIVMPGTAVTVLALDTASHPADELPDILADELLVKDPAGALYTEGGRHVLRARPATPRPVGEDEDLLRHGGTYLITGGMGGLGRIFGVWLARTYAARLVLLGRRPEDENVRRHLAALDAAGASGTLYRQADVCDAAALTSALALATANERFGRIDGVIHAAGLEQSGNITDRDPATFDRILGPKIPGTLALERALAELAERAEPGERQRPDFVCYFSSSAAILGDFGGCDYACGNRFQMSYARHLARRDPHPGGPKRLAINWPLWNSDGMNFADDVAKEFYLTSSGQRFLEPDEGTALFRLLLAQPGAQYVALAGRAERVRALLHIDDTDEAEMSPTPPPLPVPGTPPRTPLAALPQAPHPGAKAHDGAQPGVGCRGGGPPPGPGGLGGTPTQALKGLGEGGERGPGGGAPATTVTTLRRELTQTASQILRIPAERLPTDENLQDFGFDSISLVEFAGIIAERFGIDFTPDLFFTHTTLEKIHDFLLARHGERVAQLLGTPQPEAPAPTPRAKRRTRTGASTGRFAPPPVRKRRAARAAAPAPAPAEEPIAIIGMSGRFPAARTVDELWTLLSQGRSAIAPVPADDPHRHAWSATNAPNGTERRIGRIPGVAEFDPFFFEISPREAETMDPRQRLLLEEMWKALEDAACGGTQLEAERVGVFVGVEEGDYRLLAAAEEGITSNHNAVLAARLSYFLNLTGPGIAINTACSSSLLAVHEACLSLRHGDCDTAIVAGVNLMATPREYDALARAGMLSASGVCRAFDQRADGMVPGEAVAAIVLKKRDAAEYDRHPVYATILGSGVNNDGRTNGITAPSGHAQTRLVEDVHRRAGISPETVDHIVTHGTGTRLGDPVEINALAEAFRPHTTATGFCALTSTKPNLGHTLAASGLVSLISLALAMRHETIPPSINCEQTSDFVSWPDTPFYVNREPRPWSGEQRRGGVSAFGFSGTNAHVLLESHGTRRADLARLGDQPAPDAHLLLFSAKTDEALARKLTELADQLADRACAQAGPGLMSSVSHTLMSGRHHFARRVALVVRDRVEAERALRQAAAGAAAEDAGPGPLLVRGTVPRDARPAPLRRTSDLAELARRYCQGHEPDPAALWGENPPERMSLPAYPFDNRDYWVSIPATPTPNASTARTRLHPLVHENTSDVHCERFASAFTGEEGWWTGSGGGMSAGALLELARAAAVLGLGEGEVPITLHDVVCYEPATRTVHIDLRATATATAAEDGALDWALYAHEPDDGESDEPGEPYLACDGRALRTTGPTHPTHPEHPDENADTLLLELPDATGDERLLLRPGHLDACLASARTHLGWGEDDVSVTTIAEASFAAAPQPARRARITLRTTGTVAATVGIELTTDEGEAAVRIRDLTLSRQHEPDTADATPHTAVGQGRRPETRGWNVPQCVERELKDTVSQMLKFPMERLNDLDENLANYGFDSINLSQFAVELSRRLGFTLTPDLFFSHPTLARLKNHLLTNHAEHIHDWYRDESATSPTTPTPTPTPVRKHRSDRFAADTRLTATAATTDPVSIIGMSGRFPDARTIDELWSILAEGRSAVREVPEERRATWGDQPARLGWLPGVAEFDPPFFEISPREAESMDPRQRLLLEEMWKALEDAGYGEHRISGERVGVFVGVEEGDYRYLVDDDASLTSNSNSILASRLAYFLNLAGPSMAINTSCSSGLVALHEACLSLRYGDCDTAIVAAASVMSSDHDYVGMSNANMLSPDGTCYAFDRRANGMVPGEAVAVLVLKKQQAAKRDGHPVHATILGSGVNYDGRTNGITAPNGAAQARLLTSVYDRHHIAPDTLDYIVTHGTGTRLGDPIEINALAEAFRSRTDRTGFCALTSVKPNLGHSMAASGLVSLVSLVTAMKRETIPPSINCEELSDHIRWPDSPFFVNREPRPWSGEQRRGAVSSFGMSGTNAHVVLQAPVTTVDEERPATHHPHPHHLLVISAKTEDALTQRLASLADHLEATPEAGMASVSRTLMAGRHHFAHRCALVAQDREDAVRLLRQAAEGTKVPRLYRGGVPRDFAPNSMIEKVIADLAASRPSPPPSPSPDAWQELLFALAEFYCQGYDPAAFYGLWDSPPRMTPGLPTYPFAAEHYWVAAGRRTTPTHLSTERRPHPLVHAHDSDGPVHHFSSQFTGREDFLSDLLVSAERN